VTRNAIDAGMASNHDRLYKVLTNYTTFNTFGNEAWIQSSNPDEQDSIESIHDNIHASTGGQRGHMTLLEVSAYDPVFMLHHT
jgi:tyrosinase